jgi:hypothetical protein
MTYIPHDNRFRIAWNIAILGSILTFLFIITYRIVFQTFAGDALYFTLNLFFAADVAVNFFTKIKLGHRRFETGREIARHYLKGWFAIDVLAAFPFELILVAVFGGMPADAGAARLYLLLQGLTLIKLLKAGRIFRELEEALRIIPAVRRLIKFGYWFSMAIHLVALGWILIGAGEAEGTPGGRYLRAIYWVMTTIATIGYGDYTPDHASDAQIVYTIVVELFGVTMFTYIIANVSSLVSNLDVARSAYQRRLDEINAYLRAQRIPAGLQDRVRDYYSYLWASQKGVDSISVLEDMPKSLSQEILMFLNRDAVGKVELFKGAEELLLREAVRLLRPKVFLPGEHIIRQGEYGDCMYFLTSGEVRVCAEAGEIARLGPGSPFGETALLENLHRNADVISESFSTGYQLTKADFDALRSRYPEFDQRVKAVAERRKRTVV